MRHKSLPITGPLIDDDVDRLVLGGWVVKFLALLSAVDAAAAVVVVLVELCSVGQLPCPPVQSVLSVIVPDLGTWVPYADAFHS